LIEYVTTGTHQSPTFCHLHTFGTGLYSPIHIYVLLFIDFSKVFDSIHRGQLEKIMVAYERPRETVSGIMILYKDSRAMVKSPDGDTNVFDIVSGVLQGDTLAPFNTMHCLYTKSIY
jgi:hypothetical protein